MKRTILLIGLIALLLTTVVVAKNDLTLDELRDNKGNIMDKIEKTREVTLNKGLNLKLSRLFNECRNIDNLIKPKLYTGFELGTEEPTFTGEGETAFRLLGEYTGADTKNYVIKTTIPAVRVSSRRTRVGRIQYSKDGGNTFNGIDLICIDQIQLGDGIYLNCHRGSQLKLGQVWTFTGTPYNGCGLEERGILIE